MDQGKLRAVVLVVEDESLIRMCMVEYLEDAGFEVLSAEHADEAIEVLTARLDITVIITDVNMPGSMDGIRLAHAVRTRWPPVRILSRLGTGGCNKTNCHAEAISS
jgi:CheY-like chemotaxis protein